MKKKTSLKTSLKTFFEVLKYLKVYRIHFALSIILTAVSVALTLYIPILVGNAHEQIIELYSDGDMFVMDVMDQAQTKGTHWHPNDVDSAVEDIVEFMEGKSDYELFPFKQA